VPGLQELGRKLKFVCIGPKNARSSEYDTNSET
jgi:hypothetical protein